ncbi:MAG: DUF1549 domain-containing protein, partial [Pirellulaceae bacterium]|nr:DUF1549 domain-containing protein [Pirellulaceae bacterium]
MRGSCLVSLCLGLALPLCDLSASEPDSAGLALFRDKIEPVLQKHCYQCHSAAADELAAGLALDSRAGPLHGGDSGPAIVPGKPEESLLLLAIRHADGYAMPPEKPKLPEAVIADFVKWVNLGAPDPRTSAPPPGGIDLATARKHWSFQPVRAVPPPAVRDSAWPRTPIDSFVLAALEARGWKPSPPAERGAWLRRVTFDLTGLPPSPEEVAAFTGDNSPDAPERLVDRLLA